MESKQKFKPDPKLKLMDQVRQVLRYHHYPYRTEQSYCNWILRFVKFYSSKRHPRNMGDAEIEEFLSHSTDSMKSKSISQALTNHQHFGQEGFEVLMTAK